MGYVLSYLFRNSQEHYCHVRRYGYTHYYMYTCEIDFTQRVYFI